MKKYQCLIVDDERLARELIKSHLEKIPYLELHDMCANAIDAMSILQSQSIDLLFLDIQMPNLSGIELMRLLNKKPATIFTTAYSEYALEGFELDVVDYLVKPIEFERFFKAVSKAVERMSQKSVAPTLPSLPPPNSSKEADYFFIKSDYKIIKINLADISYIEAEQKYVRICTDVQSYISLISMSKILESLPQGKFIRIHRSFIVNIDRIDSIEGNMIKIKEQKLPISKGQKEAFMELVNQKGLF